MWHNITRIIKSISIAHVLLGNSSVKVNHAKKSNAQKMNFCALTPRNVLTMRMYVILLWTAMMDLMSLIAVSSQLISVSIQNTS